MPPGLLSLKAKHLQRLYGLFCRLPQGIKDVCLQRYCQWKRRQLGQGGAPVRLIWFITFRCPGKCAHCFLKTPPDCAEEISADIFAGIAGSLPTGLAVVTLTGGEPFIRDDIAQLCRALDRHHQGLVVSIPTGGFWPGKIETALRDILRTTSLRLRIHVSLDGIGRAHDEIRGYPGLFESAVETVRRGQKLQRQFPRLQEIDVATTISRANEGRLPELMRFVENELGVFQKFQFIRGARTDVYGGGAGLLSDFACPVSLMPRRTAECLEMIDDALRRRGGALNARKERLILRLVREIVESGKKVIPCVAGDFEGVIYPDGGVAACEFMRPFAQLRDYGFDFPDLWNSPAAEQMRRRKQDCFCTHPCHLLTAIMFDESALRQLTGNGDLPISPVGRGRTARP